MATWQCDFQLILDSWLRANYGEMPVSLPDEILADEDWWQTGSLSNDYAAQLSIFAPRTKSWSENLEMYGAEDGNCVQVLRDKGNIVSVSMRFDLRQIDQQFMTGAILFAHEQQCHWVDFDGKIVASEQTQFLGALKKSRAYRFVSDPHKYFEEIKNNPIRLP
jgi:hypothetical protein